MHTTISQNWYFKQYTDCTLQYKTLFEHMTSSVPTVMPKGYLDLLCRQLVGYASCVISHMKTTDTSLNEHFSNTFRTCMT